MSDAAVHIDSHGLEDSLPVVLLVDDHRMSADMERSYFAGAGFQVLVATSPSEVYDLVSAHSVDLLMIDVAFAHEQGLKVAQGAKSSSKNRFLKILMTALSEAAPIQESVQRAGCDLFLIRPVPRPKLLKQVKALTAMISRDSERVRKTFAVRVEHKSDKFDVESLDVSADGIHLACAADKLVLGASLKMQFQLPGEEESIEISGVVVRKTNEGFGVKFVAISRMAKRQLDKFLLSHSMEYRATPFYL